MKISRLETRSMFWYCFKDDQDPVVICALCKVIGLSEEVYRARRVVVANRYIETDQEYPVV